jgi:hypothetical protein
METKMIEEYFSDKKRRDLAELYYNNLEHLLQHKKSVLYWIHGHNNINAIKRVHNTHILCNQHGNKKVSTNYKKSFLLTLAED